MSNFDFYFRPWEDHSFDWSSADALICVRDRRNNKETLGGSYNKKGGNIKECEQLRRPQYIQIKRLRMAANIEAKIYL